MDTCKFIDFLETLKPWINDNYIRQAHLNSAGTFTLRFVDGGCKTYQIEDCSSEQLEKTIGHMKKNGIQVMR
jgi:hypothetical protein